MLEIVVSEAYSEPSQTSKIELFEKVVNGFQPLTIFEKSSILDVWQGSEYASGNNQKYFEINFYGKAGRGCFSRLLDCFLNCSKYL